MERNQQPPSQRGRAAESLLPLVYDELRAIAANMMHRQGPGHTLQPTALVGEAYLKLARRGSGDGRDGWESEAHFKAVAAKAMRQILVDHARAKRADKRGGGGTAITLCDDLAKAASPDQESSEVDVLALHEALEELERMDARKAKVVEMRFFAGLTIEQTAEVLGVSHMTVSADWRMARAWLMRKLEPD